MRPTSVIFLIISILLACVGGMLCLSAVSTAEETGEVLFESIKTENGNYVATKYFGLSADETPDNSSSKNNIKKIALNLQNVDVEIVGGAETNKIELYNFTEGMYSYKTSVGGALSIDDLNGLLKMVSFGTSGINFKGFRNLLFYRDYAALDRRVVVYIKNDANITNISCSVKDGSITVKNIAKTCDFTLETDSGEILVDSVAVNSSVTASANSGSVLVKNSELYTLRVKTDSAPIDVLDSPVFRIVTLETKNADINYEHISPDFTGFNVELKALDGRLTLNEEVISSGKYTFEDASDINPSNPPETGEDGEEIDPEETEEGEEYVPNTVKVIAEKGNVTVVTKLAD